MDTLELYDFERNLWIVGLVSLFILICYMVSVSKRYSGAKNKYNQKLNIKVPENVRRETVRFKSYADVMLFNSSDYIIEKLINYPETFEDVIMRANECKSQFDDYSNNLSRTNRGRKLYLDLNSVYVLIITAEWTLSSGTIEKKDYKYTWQTFLDLVEISDDITWEEYKEIKASMPMVDIEYSSKYKTHKTYRSTPVYNDEKAFAKRERSKMTNALRYDILKRDGFKCVICGRNAEDGVKLHVDHIKPIAKGGLTVRDNLRTLCDDCNFGKGAKYDPNGVN